MFKKEASDNSKKKIHKADDRLFKAAMSRKESVISYLKTFHWEIAKTLDLEALRPVNDSFLSPNLRTFSADIIWKCRLKNSKKETNISFLWEHKMQENNNYSIQVGTYIFLFWHKLVITDGKPLEPILPLLFYNGKASHWRPPTIHQLFADFDGFDNMKQFLPEFEPLFVNLTGTAEETIREIEFGFLKSAFFAMFWGTDEDLLVKKFSVIFESDSDDIAIHQLILYIISKTNKSKETLSEIFKKIDSPIKKEIMSTYDQIVAETAEWKQKAQTFEKKIQTFQQELKSIEKRIIIAILNLHKEKFNAEKIAVLLAQSPDFVKEVIGKKEEFKDLMK